MEDSKNLITKDMTIGEVVSRYPQVASVLQSFGLHCIGCHVNPYETLEQGVISHGMSKKVLQDMLMEANRTVLQSNNGPSKSLIKQENQDNEKVTLSLNAAQKLLEFRKNEKKEQEHGLRVMAAPGGCAGFMYRLEFDTPKANDQIFEQNGIKLIISSDQFEMLKGTVIDYVDSLEGSGFKINNPNATSSCGCGKSFH